MPPSFMAIAEWLFYTAALGLKGPSPIKAYLLVKLELIRLIEIYFLVKLKLIKFNKVYPLINLSQ